MGNTSKYYKYNLKMNITNNLHNKQLNHSNNTL